MKLYEAILIGCKRRAQATRRYFKPAADGAVHSCALGAAYEGTFNTLDFGDVASKLAPHYDHVTRRHAVCPGSDRWEGNHPLERFPPLAP